MVVVIRGIIFWMFFSLIYSEIVMDFFGFFLKLGLRIIFLLFLKLIDCFWLVWFFKIWVLFCSWLLFFCSELLNIKLLFDFLNVSLSIMYFWLNFVGFLRFGGRNSLIFKDKIIFKFVFFVVELIIYLKI